MEVFTFLGRHVNKEEKERHSGKSYRDNRSRDRDHRDSSRRQGRDSHKMRSKPEDASTKE